MVDRPPWPAMELTGAQPSGRSGPRRLAVGWGKGGRLREFILASTEVGKAARRWHTSSRTLARKGDGVDVVGTKRRIVGGVGIFTGGGAAFCMVEARRGRSSAFNGRR
jgi:hypothetical protein